MALKFIAPFWTGLGFYRGTNLYNYTYNYKCIEHEKEENKISKKPTYFYTGCLGSAVCGGLMYINPFFLPIITIKEIYRLEIELRGLNEEKEKISFYEIL